MYELPPLPYAESALEPWISRATLRVHHGILERAYYDKVRAYALARGDQPTIVQLMTSANPARDAAAQAWNHGFLWRSMSPSGGGPIPRWAGTRASLKQAAKGLFGSGWLWITADAGGRAFIQILPNGDNPVQQGLIPLLTMDLWEHAYMLDYPGCRAEYVDVFLNHLANWDFAEANYRRAFG